MKTFSILFTALSVISLIIYAVCLISWWYDFSGNCEDYLKLAGDAPNVNKAADFLGTALNYIELNHLTSGNSAIYFKKPDADLGIWYEQLLGAYETADSLRQSTASQLELDNALMKIREVVLDGTIVTVPTKITWYPSQIGIFWWLILSIICLIISIICVIVLYEIGL